VTLATRLAALEAQGSQLGDTGPSVIWMTPLLARADECRNPWDAPMASVSIDGMRHPTVPDVTGRDAVLRILAAMPDRPPVALAFLGEALS
jgi:hypothetical protein